MAMEGGSSVHTLSSLQEQDKQECHQHPHGMGRAGKTGTGISPNVPLKVPAPGASYVCLRFLFLFFIS